MAFLIILCHLTQFQRGFVAIILPILPTDQSRPRRQPTARAGDQDRVQLHLVLLPHLLVHLAGDGGLPCQDAVVVVGVDDHLAGLAGDPGKC